MRPKLSLLTLWLVVFLQNEIVIGRSPIQFSGRSFMSQEQRDALMQLVNLGEASSPGRSDSASTRQNKIKSVKTAAKSASKTVKKDVPTLRATSTGAGPEEQLQEGCMKKVVMVEEIEFDTVVSCEHVYQESCFESYTTAFKKTKAEECDESFKKECEIEYHKVPKEEKVEICNEQLTRDCDAEGEIVCSKEYETICETVFEEHEITEDVPNCETVLEEKCTITDTGEEWCGQVEKRKCTVTQETTVKVTPTTECRKAEAEVCGPETCPIVRGDKVCKDEIKTIIQNVPQESCSMVPRKICNIVSKVIPTLEPVKHCLEIPKEVCAKSRINPVRKKRPVVRKWCVNPEDEDDDGSGDGSGDGDGGVDEVPENALYAISVNDDLERLTALILDPDTGDIVCKKELNSGQPAATAELYYTLVGPDRELLQCGASAGDSAGKCQTFGADGAAVDDDRATGLEALPGAANFDYDGTWLILGGFTPTDKVVTAVPTDGAVADVQFLETTFSAFFDEARDVNGGCLRTFAGPDADTTVHAYVVNDGQQNADVYLSRTVVGGDTISVKVPISARQVVTNTCGHAVTSDGAATAFYFVTTDSSGTDPTPKLQLVRVATGDIDVLEDQLTGAQTVAVEEPTVTAAVTQAGGVLPATAEQVRTVWLGDHRSLMLQSEGRTIMVDVDSDTVDVGPEFQDLSGNARWAYVSKAADIDLENLGCNSS